MMFSIFSPVKALTMEIPPGVWTGAAMIIMVRVP